VTVVGAFGIPRLQIGATNVSPTLTVDNGDGSSTFTIVIPPNITSKTEACPAGGTRPLPTQFDVKYTSAESGCTDTFMNGLTVDPPATGKVFFNPAGFAPFTSVASIPGSAGPPVVAPVPGRPSASQTIELVNNGAAPLTITSVGQSAGCASFQLGLPPNGTILDPCDAAAVSATYTAVAPGSSSICTLTFNTSAGTKTLTLTGSAQ
jgi:hypothetical protein